MRAYLTAALLAFSCSPAAAYFYTGNELWTFCKNESSSSCLVYILSAVDMHTAAVEDGKFFCIPPKVTGGQIEDVVKKYLQDNPADRHKPAAFLVIDALQAVFPCKQ